MQLKKNIRCEGGTRKSYELWSSTAELIIFIRELLSIKFDIILTIAVSCEEYTVYFVFPTFGFKKLRLELTALVNISFTFSKNSLAPSLSNFESSMRELYHLFTYIFFTTSTTFRGNTSSIFIP